MAYLKSAKYSSFLSVPKIIKKKNLDHKKKKNLTKSIIDLETVSFSPSIVIFAWIHDPIAATSDVKPTCISDGEEGRKRSKDDESKT